VEGRELGKVGGAPKKMRGKERRKKKRKRAKYTRAIWGQSMRQRFCRFVIGIKYIRL